MKKKIISLLLGCILIYSHLSSIGQNTDPCSCNVAIPQNLRDEFTSIYQSDFRNSLSLLFSKSFTYWEDGEWQNNRSIESGGSYGVYSGFFNGSENRQQKEQKFLEKKAYFETHQDISESDYKYLSQKTASRTAYDAWIRCKLGCELDEMILQKFSTIDGEVTVNLIYKHRNTTDFRKIDHIELRNVTLVKGSQLKKRLKVVGKHTYTGTFKLINPEKDALIKINAGDYETETLIIPGSSHTLIKNDPVQEQTAKIKVENGQVKENSKLTAEWGIKDVDTEVELAKTWRNVPFGFTSHYHEAAWAKTLVEAKVLSSRNDFYSWNLEITNLLGGKSGPNGLGGFGEVNPAYQTNISLPTLKNDSESYYTIILKCGTYCGNSGADSRHGIGKTGKVSIRGRDLDTSFTFVVDNNLEQEKLTIDGLKSGEYSLDMQMPTIMAGNKGLHVSDPKAITDWTFATKLQADISAHEIVKPSPPNPEPPNPRKNYFVYIIVGVAILALFIFFLVKRKRN